MLTTRAPTPSKPAELSKPAEPSEPVGPSKPIGPSKPAGASKFVEPSNPLALAALAAPTHVAVTEIPGRFAVIRHAVTIPRIPGFRFDLWITTAMITSELSTG
ncbi:hypothetical protein FHS35_003084 [Streptomyces umbrinus]|uniref:hypothetical protein n=1 Tax=Streptomyces TaxID=1883 RepID=UPI00198B3CDA|nr:hypothetical protein [Streptomyces umbrinus]MCR3726232.1 hypothetical protein [Streptomyces umbrinus]MCX4561382.1 hypothetical protein [Streptomyces phaeochromogenes]GHB50657.1 hypothetical protein GCM10010306_050240 [Streptomyces umbrinus]GHH31952.1 hypothetical protein GCM10018775_00660 [Streptomyces umbrinus]